MFDLFDPRTPLKSNKTTSTLHPLGYNPAELNPGVVHIGFGNFARAFVGPIFHDLATKGHKDWGIVAVGPSKRQERDIAQLSGQNFVYHLIQRNKHENVQPIGSFRDCIIGEGNTAAVINQMADSRTKVVTLTITEAGYGLDVNRNFVQTPKVDADLLAIKRKRYDQVKTVPGWIAASLFARYVDGKPPYTVISFDNLPRNGDLTKKVITSFAAQLDFGFAHYVQQECVFPNSVVDRVTPNQDYYINSQYLSATHSIKDDCAVVCEAYRRLILKNLFTEAGSPPMQDSEHIRLVPSVGPYEDRKLRLFNGSHLAIGIMSKMLQVQTVHQAVTDPHIGNFFLHFLSQASSSLSETAGIPIEGYTKDTFKRLANPRITDDINRLLASTTSKVNVRLFNEIGLKLGHEVNASAFAIAAWLHYMHGRDASGNPYNLHEKDVGKLQELGLDDPTAEPDRLIYFLAKKDAALPAESLKTFSDRIIEHYKHIHNNGLREALANTFPEAPNILGKTHIADSPKVVLAP